MSDPQSAPFQAAFWSGLTTGGRDVYAPTQEGVQQGQVQRWILPSFDSGNGGWAGQFQQPAPIDPELQRMGYQQTGIFGGPGGRAELYRGPQTPPIGVPVGFGGLGHCGHCGQPVQRPVRRPVRRFIPTHRPQQIRNPGMSGVSDGMALGLVAALFIGVPALVGWLGKKSSGRPQRAW